eukprot:XP_025013196.1 putative disease resistance protein At3g14460 [Ricinus communis]
MLCKLQIKGCEELVHGGVVTFSSPNSMVVSTIAELAYLTEEFMEALNNVEELKILYCNGLKSLWQKEDAEQLNPGWGSEFKYLEVRHCESLEILPQCLHSFVFLRELLMKPALDSFSFQRMLCLPCLRVIRIKNCSALAPLPAVLTCNCKSLENLCIEGCDSLISFARSQLPPTLKRLEIRSCKNLQYLLSDGESSSSSSLSIMYEKNINTSNLEYLDIYDCPSLMSLSSRGKLPAALVHLQIKNCSELTSFCAEGKLPAGLKPYHCLVSFLGRLPTTNLRELCISWCEELEALPDHLHNLTSLQELWIYDCPGIVSFPEEGFPTKLTSVTITNLNICKPLFEWGLQRLNSLRDLYIEGGCSMFFPSHRTRQEWCCLPP